MSRGIVFVLLHLLLCATLPPARAADQPGGILAAALASVEPDLVPTGILYDRVLPMSRLDLHNGHGAAPPVTTAQWRQMLHELTRASLVEPNWPTVADARNAGRAARASGVVPLAVLDCVYNQLRPDALDRGLLRWEGESLVVAPGATASDLTTEAHAFVAAPLVDHTCRGAEVHFVLSRRFYIGTEPNTLARLEIDAADGLGFRPLTFDVPVHVAYAAPGSKTLRLRATLADGTRLVSAFRFDVSALQAPPPSDTWPITATIPYQSAAGSGHAYLYLADGHTALTNPAVVIEGFDLDNSMAWDELYLLLNQENLLEDLRADGYDAVVLDFAEATEPIQRNAFVLVELLAQVQAAVADDQDLIVVGASMGGLVARYALSYMETNALPHRSRGFISFDVPHRGANIPLGLQYWLDFFEEQSTEAAYLLSRLDTPAARQMLLYHHTTPPGATGESDPLRADFVADLAAVGDWPQTPRLVAVANGSGARADQGYAAGAQIIRYEHDSFLVDIRGNVWAVPDASSLRIFQGLIDLVWPLPDEQMNVTVSGTRSWDNAPGGYRASLAQMDTTAVPYGDIVALHPNHCFIPTISALALDTEDPFFDIAGAPDLLALTPLDAVYYPAVNQEHVLITPENKAWLLDEIERAPSDVVLEPAAPIAGAMLRAGYPNPLNPATTIGFALPAAGQVRLSIYDAAGRLVRTLVEGELPHGAHAATWEGQDNREQPVASGTYLSVLRTAAGTLTRKIAVVR